MPLSTESVIIAVMGKKSSKSNTPESRGSKVLKILGLIVVLSFVLAPLLPNFVSIQPPPTSTLPPVTFIYATLESPTPTSTVTPTPTSAAPVSPTPGLAPAPPSP